MSVTRGNSGRSRAEQTVEVVRNGEDGTDRAGKARGFNGRAHFGANVAETDAETLLTVLM